MDAAIAETTIKAYLKEIHSRLDEVAREATERFSLIARAIERGWPLC